jgi:hypothetical protein
MHRRMTPTERKWRLESTILAARAHLPEERAEDVVRNAATSLTCDEAVGLPTDPEQAFRDALEHRRRVFGWRLGWPEQCVRDCARAWRAGSGPIEVG